MKPESSRTEKENAKNTRISLQVLQPEAGGKENLVGGSRTPLLDKKDAINLREKSTEKRRIVKDVIENVQAKEKKKKMSSKAVQVDKKEEKVTITAEDLTSEEPSENYWKILAERRRVALDESLKENMTLHEKVALLEEENRTIKEMYENAKKALDILKEVINENWDGSDDDNGEDGDDPKDNDKAESTQE